MLSRETRVLHVVGGMNPGGVETWLMTLLRHMDRQRFRMDFLTHTERRGTFDDEVRSLGSNLIPCLHPHRPLAYARNFQRILQEHGPYDVVHSHVHHYSGFTLRLAQRSGVNMRIAHSHSDTQRLQKRAGRPRRLYLALMKRWIRSHATTALACSRQAARALGGSAVNEHLPWRVLPYGFDLAPFRSTIDSVEVRSELGIPPDAIVVGHVGRFTEAKNHEFQIEIARQLLRLSPQTRLLLVGDGPLRLRIEEKVVRLGLEGKVIFAGQRLDVPRLLLGAMDVFLFPSLFEGLGQAVVQAQAAGLPCVLSQEVPEEVEVVPSLLKRLSLSDPPSRWASAILEFPAISERPTQRASLEMVEASSFNIEESVQRIEQIYCA